MVEECYGTVIIQNGMFRRNTIGIPVQNIASYSGSYVKAPDPPKFMCGCLILGALLICLCAFHWPEESSLVVLFFTPAAIGVVMLVFWIWQCKIAQSLWCFVVNPKYGDPIRITLPTQDCYNMLRECVERVIRDPNDDVYLYMDFDNEKYEIG